ncbi:Cupin 1 [Pleurostoma richardsiae]|uniref:Cupin 1 n=1 Tax=Pleurostoma richardsiae TaxID=41990 RepID=A0AA38REC6_9PEZI|nr:Cupin 1 [Pleurostoma richardsiae]
MVQIDKYVLPPTALIPNSPYPLLRYRRHLSPDDPRSVATQFYDLLSSNGWQAQWIFRYGSTQKSHYHSLAHECMVVLTGKATVRFGVADTAEDLDESTWGGGKEDGGIELEAQAGDVFIIPAGVAHKTFDAQPTASFKLLTPGDGHDLPPDVRSKLDSIELSGFTMMGAYPRDGGPWDFAVGGEGATVYASAWALPRPNWDPVLGESEEGLCTLWDPQNGSGVTTN